MNLLDLMVKIGVDDQASSRVDEISASIGGKLSKAANVAKVAIAALGAATVGVTKSALDAYAAYEQNVGGIKKLFGTAGQSLEEYAKSHGKSVSKVSAEYRRLQEAEGKMLSYAQNAWRTAGVSANTYMEQATSFSASLISSLGGDTVKAAEYADKAITDMSDNANTFGTDMQDIQNAYQGFAKQNYTMLDNLKLGYGGTKSEMERLIEDANKLRKANGEAADLTIESYADIIEAIHTVQVESNIAGTTQREALETVEGSINATKAAWENFLTGLGSDDADLSGLTENLVTAVEAAATNIVPRIGVIMGSLGEVVGKAILGDDAYAEVSAQADEIAQKVTKAFEQAGGAAESFGMAVDDVRAGIGAAVEGAMPYLDALAEKMSDPSFQSFASALWSELGDVWNSLCYVAGELATAVGFVFDSFMELSDAVGAGEWDQGEDNISLIALAIQALGNVLAAPIILFGDLIKVIADVIDWFNGLGEGVESAGEGVQSFMDDAGETIDGFAEGVNDAFGAVTGLIDEAGAAFESAQDTIGTAMDGAAKAVSDPWGTIKGLFSHASSIVSPLSGAFAKAKKFMSDPIGSAKEAIDSAMKSIERIFSGTNLKFPDIKTPHFSIDGGEAPFGFGGKGRFPSVSVDWYAKGGFLDKLSLIGVAEEGAEGILPLQGKHMLPFAEAVSNFLADSGKGGGNRIYITLNYTSDADATQMVMDIAEGLRLLDGTGA